MKKILIFFAMMFVFIALSANSIVSAAGNPLPERDNPIWNIMKNMKNPTDSNCSSLAATELATTLYSGREIEFCLGIAQISEMEKSLDENDIVTNLFKKDDWRNITGLYFEDEEFGKIEFTKPINFMSYDFLTFLSTFTDRFSMDRGEIGLNADIVGGLYGYGAMLTMYGAGNFEDPEILIDGKKDKKGVVSGLTYDPKTKNITFNAAHFTTFKAVESAQKASIKKVEAKKYVKLNGKKRIKIVMSGKDFDSKAKVKIGTKSAHKIKKVNDRKLIAYFKTNELDKLGDAKVYLKVKNPKAKSDKFKKKFTITDIGKNMLKYQIFILP